MDKATAQVSLRKISAEVSSLTPSTLIQMFEIDLSNLVFNEGLIGYSDDQKVFRFHNSVKLINTEIIWQGKTYVAAPIAAEGFEFNGRGALPTPKLTLTSSEEGITAISIIKSMIARLGDLVGGKVTRIRTFAKYLDASNFYAVDANNNAILSQPIDKDIIPDGFSPDPNAEFPRDVYYIDRKSVENKSTIQFELASILDVEGVKLPARLVFADRCVWSYRGEGCCYEYKANRTSIHGEAELPDQAPAVANDKNEKISVLIGRNIVYRGQYDSRKAYAIGDTVWVERDGVKYHFTAKAVPLQPPPNTNYWIADSCSKDVAACKMRWGNAGSVIIGGANASKIAKGKLRYGGFPAVNKLAG